MMAAAEAAGKKLMIQFNNRFRPEAKLLKEYVTGGELGDIYFARCGWIRRNGIPGWGGWFTQKRLSGGGPLIDLGVHMLDLTMWLMGNPEPTTVFASAFSEFGPYKEGLGPWGTPTEPRDGGKFNVEDMAVAMIKFVDGQTILLEASWASYCKREQAWSTLMGDDGGASLERVFDIDGVDDSAIDTLQLFTQEHGVPVNRDLVVEPDPAMGRHNAVMHFVDCLVDGVEMISPASDGLRIMEILDAAYESAETGKTVNIE
jgi:predicted dehydrogenase